MSESCDFDCAGCETDCPSRKAPQENDRGEGGGQAGCGEPPVLAPHELSKVKHIIAVMSGKGGVGKSLVTALAAVELSRAGYAVGILDADVTGPSIPRMFGVEGDIQGSEAGAYPLKSDGGIDIMSMNLLLSDQTDPVVWRGPVISSVVRQFWQEIIWEDVDYLFVDMPPGTGDVPLTVFQSLPVDGIIVVTSPQDLVNMIVEKAVKMANMMDIPILGVVENMSYFRCPDCGKEHHIFGESHLAHVAAQYDIPVLGRLPVDHRLAEASDGGEIETVEGHFLDEMTAVLKELDRD